MDGEDDFGEDIIIKTIFQYGFYCVFHIGILIHYSYIAETALKC